MLPGSQGSPSGADQDAEDDSLTLPDFEDEEPAPGIAHEKSIGDEEYKVIKTPKVPEFSGQAQDFDDFMYDVESVAVECPEFIGQEK